MRRSILTIATVILATGIFALAGCVLTQTEAPQIKQVTIKSTQLTYQEQGRGRLIVFVHGAITDYRTWDGQREAGAAQNRFIALTMRYFGTDPWPDAGANYSMKTHTDAGRAEHKAKGNLNRIQTTRGLPILCPPVTTTKTKPFFFALPLLC